MKNRRSGRHGAEKTRLHSHLAQKIGEQILSGAYGPGDLLPNEAEWCRMYGASRTAVREAIKGLNAKGLLVSRPKVGSRVEPREHWNMLDRDVLAWAFAVGDTKEMLQSIQEVRRVIEPEVAALAASKRTSEQLDRLREALADMGAAAGPAEAVAPDVRFHLAVLESANNPLLSPFGSLIESALRNLFDYTTHARYEPDLVMPLHRTILKAIEKGDAEGARKAARALLKDTDDILAGHARSERRVALKRAVKADLPTS
jgi:DNA-binding FadR family transcriptional regulator